MTTDHLECQICHTPFEYGDIMIGKDGGRKFCYFCAVKAADMFETTDAVIGRVTPVDNGWEIAFAPDCTTWITVRRDEHDEPKVGDYITVTVPKAVAIHSQPNPAITMARPPRLAWMALFGVGIKRRSMKTLEQHNAERRKSFHELDYSVRKPHPNGIECPKCGKELWDSDPMCVLTSNPQQKNVHCPACGYRGYRVA